MERRIRKIKKIYDTLRRLVYNTGVFPTKELQYLIKHQERAIPILLELMENVRDDYRRYSDDCIYVHLYATYLLAQFRVKEFFDIMIDLAMLPDEVPFELYDFGITEDLARILASVYHGDHSRIYELIEDKQINPSIRMQGISFLIILFLQGILRRKEVVSYLKDLLMKKAKLGDFEIVTGIVYGLNDLYPGDSIEVIDWAYEHRMVDPFLLGYGDIEDNLKKGMKVVMDELKENHYMSLIGDVHTELGDWACFNGSETKLIRFGSNAPCSCGSGKRARDCCD